MAFGLKKFGVKTPGSNAGQKRFAPKRRPILKWTLISVPVLGLLGALSVFFYWQSLLMGKPDLPATADLWDANREAAIEFLDANGETLAIRGPRYGRSVALSDLPPHVARAFIAAEDKRFYDHNGADTKAMMRAAIANIVSGKTVSGASTITQQLVKNLVLSPEQTLKRKAQEITLARELETRLSKDEILELYLNRVYFGSGFYGLGAASRFYFGKDPVDLTLAEASLLATLPKAPSRLALDDNMQGAKARQAYVLAEMVQAGFITPQSALIAIESDVTIAPEPESDPQFGFILDNAVEQVSSLLPEIPDDLVITLTIDKAMQEKVTEAIEARLEKESEKLGVGQAAAILIRRSGEVAAIYGGRDYLENQFNRATQAQRQPGSAFKPFVYAAALEQGGTPYDVYVDEPVKFDKWAPQNFNRAHIGPVTVAEAMRDSLNTVAAIVGQEVGEDKVIDVARRFGITKQLEPFPSIALGSQEVTLWELTRAYGPFMTGGMRVDPYIVAKIETSRGETLYERAEYEPARVFPRDDAELMTAMLAEVIREGTGHNAKLRGWPIAGKTGTSQSSRDAWFVGYSAVMLGGVWTGNDDDTPMKGVTGGSLPAYLWSDIMAIGHEGQKPVALRGADKLVQLTPEQQARVDFYRDLTMAFAGTMAN